MTKQALRLGFVFPSLALISMAVSSTALAAPDLKFGGYIKADFMVSDYKNGAPDDGSLSRQFYIPGTIYGDPNRGNSVTDFHARETRFNVTATDKIQGHDVKFFLETDFLTTVDGNERVSNSYTPRLRHATVTFDRWTAGQTWTTFQNVGALPEALTFIGAAEGTPFIRQSLIRYTSDDGWQLALENPKSTFTDLSGDRVESDSSFIPDFVARYDFTRNGAKFSVAALLRQLEIDQTLDTVGDGTLDTVYDARQFGYGLSLAGIIPINKRDKLKMMLNYGDGTGRYIALNFANAGAIDNNGEISTISSISGFISYQHWWNSQWRSNFTLSGFEADNPSSLSGNNANSQAYSGNINLLYSPIKPLTIGIEYFYASNEQEDGDDGELNRILMSFKYVI